MPSTPHEPLPWNDSDLPDGSVLVTRDQFLDAALDLVRVGTESVLVEALAAAADEDGLLEDFDEVEFYEVHVARAMADEEVGETTVPLTYDRFNALTFDRHLLDLGKKGLLAQRGRGDSYDYHLTLPADEVPS